MCQDEGNSQFQAPWWRASTCPVDTVTDRHDCFPISTLCLVSHRQANEATFLSWESRICAKTWRMVACRQSQLSALWYFPSDLNTPPRIFHRKAAWLPFRVTSNVRSNLNPLCNFPELRQTISTWKLKRNGAAAFYRVTDCRSRCTTCTTVFPEHEFCILKQLPFQSCGNYAVLTFSNKTNFNVHPKKEGKKRYV